MSANDHPPLVGNVTFDTPKREIYDSRPPQWIVKPTVPAPGASNVFQQTANTPLNAAQGWECPRCHRMNSPFINSCDCKPGATEQKP